MVEYLNRSAYAQRIGVAANAINIAVKEGRVHWTPNKGIDPDHPTNKYYVEKLDSNPRARTKKKQPARRPRQISKKEYKEMMARRREMENNPDQEIDIFEGITPKEREKPAPEMRRAKPKRKYKPINPSNSAVLGEYTKSDVDKAKVIEQIKAIQVKTDFERGKLIERKLVQRLFAKLYLIDSNEFKTLGYKVAPTCAAACGTDDNEAVIKVAKIIEDEIYLILEHIKRMINDHLENMEFVESEDNRINENLEFTAL